MKTPEKTQPVTITGETPIVMRGLRPTERKWNVRTENLAPGCLDNPSDIWKEAAQSLLSLRTPDDIV